MNHRGCVKRRALIRGLRCVTALALVAAAPVAPALFGGKVLLPADLLMVMLPFRAHARELGFRRVSNPILDAVQQFWPWRKFAGEQLRRGVVPLWNPYMLCGTPFVANDQSAVFYPETWLFAALEPERAFAWAAFAAVFASGCFMFAFLRTWGLRRRAAMVGAVAWMYNGFAVGWMCLPSFRSVPVWLPLLLASIAGLSSGRKVLVWTGVGAVAVAMNFLAGNLHISFYVLLTAVAFAGWMALAKRPRLFGVLAGTAAFMAVGAAMAAVQLLPTVEYAFRSHRQHISYDTVLMYRLPWPYLAACLMPDLFGNPVDYNHWGCMLGDQYRAYTETAWYAGAVTVVLAVLAFRRGRWRADALFWGAVAVVALALAVGSPLNYLFYASVPGFRQLPGINRAIVMAAFALATLGAIGAQGLLESSEVGAQRSRMGRALSSAAAGVTLVGGVSATWAWVYSGRYEAALGVPLASYTGLQFLRFLAAVLVPVGAFGAWLYRRCNALWNLAVVALALDMSYFAAHFTPMVSPRYCRPPSEIVGLLQRETVSSDAAGLRVRLFSEGSNPITGRMPPNVPMLFGLYDIQGSDSITYGRYVRLLQHLRPSQEEENGKFSQPCVDLRALGRLGVRWILTDWDLLPPAQLVATEGKARLYVLPDGLRDIAGARAVVCSEDRLLEAVAAAGSTQVSSGAVIVDPEAFRWLVKQGYRPPPAGQVQAAASAPPGPRAGTQPTRVLVKRPQPSLMKLTPVGRRGFRRGELLVVRETMYPGWRAYGDGQSLPMAPVDYCFTGILVREPYVAGPVWLIFEPSSFKTGMFVSAIGLAICVALMVAGAGAGWGWAAGSRATVGGN